MKSIKANRILSLLMAVCLMLGMIPLTAAAEAGGACTHEHGEVCSYVEGVPCGHVCGEDCSDGCIHTNHDADCGYIEAVDCDHVCDVDCGGLSLGDSGDTAIIVAALDELPEETLYQGYDFDTVTLADLDLPDTLTGTDEDGNPLTITGVAWRSAPDFDPAKEVAYPGYIFTPTLPAGYTLAEGVKAPVITVFIQPEGEVNQQGISATGTMTIGGTSNVDLTQDANGTGWTWTAASNTLALDSTYEGSYINIFCNNTDTINLEYSGNVTVSGSDGYSAINCLGNLNISGSGDTLNLSAQNSALCASGNLNISSGTITAESTDTYASGIFSNGSIAISGSDNVTATATGSDSYGINAQSGAVTISTSGTVDATGDGFGIACGSVINIISGTVTAKGSSYGLSVGWDQAVNISGGTVTVGETGGSNGNVYGDLTVSGATTSVTVNGNITDGGNLTVSDGTATVTGTVSGNTTVTGGTVSVNGQPVAPAGTITGTMTIGGQSNVNLAGDTTDTGWAWTASTATLTLDSSYVAANPIAIDCQSTDTINLVYTGNVSITSGSASTIYCKGNLNISESGSGGTLTITSSSSNSLYCAIEVVGALEISSGTINAAAAGSGTSPNAAVIYGSRGVTITGSANVTTNATGTDASGIYVEAGDITISTSGTVTANGTGAGGALAIMNGRKLNMSSGSLVLTGVPLKGSWFAELNISGGSITIGGTAVYRAELTLSGVNTVTDVTAVTSPASGYGISSVGTSASGKLHFLLPAGNHTVTLTAGGDTYTGTVNVTIDNAATATLTAQGGSGGQTVNISTNISGSAYGNSNDGGVTADPTQPNGNTLNINNGGIVNPMAIGAEIPFSNGAKSATGNTVNVKDGGTVQGLAIGAHVVSSDDAATASGNSAHVAAGGAVGIGVTGGSAQANASSGSEAAIANNNTVTIGGTVGTGGGIYGGNANSGFSGTATASGNVVTINNSAIVGSQVAGGAASAGSSGLATASNNSVIINSGAVNGNVIGGMAYSPNARAINNTVTVKGGTFGATSVLRGGDFGIYSGDAVTGNTLNLHSTISVAGAENFENLNFYLPASISNGGTMLTTTAAADLTGVTVNVSFDSAAPSLAAGDVITLIDGVTGTFAAKSVTVGSLTLDLSVSGGKLIATVPGGTTYAVTVSSTGTGATGAGNYAATATVNIGAGTPPAGQQFKNWTSIPSVTFANATSSNTSFTMPASAVTVTANFEALPPDTYSITVQNDGNGTASANVNSAQQNVTITLTATPNSGYQFKEWQVISGSMAITGNSFTMPAENVTVKAIFEVIPATTYTVNFNLNGGTRTGGGALTQTVAHGASATAPIVTRSGYTLTGWDKPFSNVTANMTVTAQWSYDGGGNNGGGGNGGGGSSSSGGGSSYTPTTPITTDKQPNMPIVAKAGVSGTVKDNALSATITEKMVKDAIAAAGSNKDGIAIQFNITGSGDFVSVAFTFNRAALEALKTAGVKYVQIGSALIDLSLDTNAITGILAQTTGNITVTATWQTKLSDAAKALIGSRPVFDINIKDSKGVIVSDLKGGSVTIGIAYMPTSTEKTGNLYSVYVDNNGKPTLLTNSSYDNGRLIFKRGSLSVYGVGYKAPAPAFTDTANHWAKDNIDFVASRDLITGTSATAFSPDTAITRADFLMALGKLSGADVSGYTTSSFTDVPNTNPAMPYIEWAVQKKIVQGIGNNKFGPDNKITREDMAVMMVNYAKATGYTLPVSKQYAAFADDAKISSYAKDAVKAIQQTGVINGKTGNLFDPKGNATRAEASTILRRFVELVIDEGTARGWVQNDAGQWQYINTNGKAVTGWLNTEANKYWFDDKGIMAAGKWVQVSGKWYYFYSDGKLAVNTTIDGYTVGADGARKE